MEKLLDFALGLSLFGLFTSTIYTALAALAVRRFVRRKNHDTQTFFQPPVSLLKPLHGAEVDLEAHLATFFQQDYAVYEILFCARQMDDPGLAAARRVAARYPHVPVQFLASGEPTLPNAKIQSLERMAQAAQYDLLIISDSDVRVRPEYVREVVAPFFNAEVGAVTCLYRGVAVQGGLWSRIEAAAMSVEMSAGVLVADMLEAEGAAIEPVEPDGLEVLAPPWATIARTISCWETGWQSEVIRSCFRIMPLTISCCMPLSGLPCSTRRVG